VGVVPAVPAAAAPGGAGTVSQRVGVWRSVPLPRTVTEPAALYSVTAVSRSSAWAAGQESLGRASSRGLILHWNGLRWVKERLPGPPVFALTVISSVSAADAWALGYETSGTPVILHRLRGTWRDVPVPPDLQGWNVDTIAGGRLGTAWVWGYNGSRFGFVLEHWDGAAWHRIAVPFADWGDMRVLRSAGPAGIWAAGDTTTGGSEVLHWDGRSWSQITGPPNTFLGLTDVLVRQPRDIWATGEYCLAAQPGIGCTSGGAQIAHWNGGRWDELVRQPSIGSATTVSAGASGQPLWAGLDVSNPARILYDHFDGHHWSVIPSTPLRSINDVSSFTTHIPGTVATWAVGSTRNSSTFTAFIQVNDGN